MTNKSKATIIISVIGIIVLAGAGYFVMSGLKKAEETINTNGTNGTTNGEPQANANLGVVNAEDTNTATVLTNQELVTSGTVFIKGIKTPSESYGLLTSDGAEIGFEKYDSRKEEFRPYVGEKINITFESVCRSSVGDCCRTLFYYCGTIKSWEPIE